MRFRIKILFNLCLVVNVWVTAEDVGTDVTVSSDLEASTSPPEEVHDTAKEIQPVYPTPDPEENPHTIDRSSRLHQAHAGYIRQHHGPGYHGLWKKKFLWRPRWVKTWQEKKVYIAVWKRMWAPALINEWVPVPKPPPGWVKPGGGSYAIKTHPFFLV